MIALYFISGQLLTLKYDHSCFCVAQTKCYSAFNIIIYGYGIIIILVVRPQMHVLQQTIELSMIIFWAIHGKTDGDDFLIDIMKPKNIQLSY